MIHLHSRSHYSALESGMSIQELVWQAKQQGFSAIALTDLGHCHGFMAFKKACQQAGLRPIYGMEISVEGHPFVLLAKHQQDMSALYRFAAQPPQTLAELGQDCIKISLSDHLIEAPFTYVQAIMMNDSLANRSKNQGLLEASRQRGISCVALNYTLYAKENDLAHLRLLAAIRENKTVNHLDLVVLQHRYLRSFEEMAALYDQSLLASTDQLAALCQADILVEKGQLPHFDSGYDNRLYLRSLCLAGLKKRQSVSPIYQQRLEKELTLIEKMGFVDYFLLVYDLMRYAHTQHFLVGPGRGSAVGSLVAYCLGITHVDPVKHDLLFERFLHEQRVGLPDIDMDFPDVARQPMLNYVREKYGSDHVAQIVTYQRFKAKAALKDAAKALGVQVGRVSGLSRYLEKNNRLSAIPKASYEHDPVLNEVMTNALAIEGLIRHRSIHAAGVVVNGSSLVGRIPLTNSEAGWISQYDKDELEQLGFVKFDFLSLNYLTTVQRIVSLLKEPIDVLKLPEEDGPTFELFNRGLVLGLFQFDQRGMAQTAQKVGIHKMDDLAAVLALFRPGPMKHIPEYVYNQQHPEQISYMDERLKPILSSTNGIILYQEQIMEIGVRLAGMSHAQADQMRKAMAKKDAQSLAQFRERIEKASPGLFAWIAPFAEYGFNKSHAYGYARLSFIMAYLKAHYPLAYYLVHVAQTKKDLSLLQQECAVFGIELLPVSLHESGRLPKEKKGHILLEWPRLGIRADLADRLEAFHFSNDFVSVICELVMLGLNEDQIQTLVSAGVLDGLGINRTMMLENLEMVLLYAGLVLIKSEEGFRLNYELAAKPVLTQVASRPEQEARLSFEAYGIYLGDNPLRAYRQRFQTVLLNQIRQYGNVVGFVKSIKKHTTKRQEEMAFVSLQDESGTRDVTLFPDVFRKVSLEPNQIVLMKVKKDAQNRLSASQIRVLTQA